MSAHPHVVERLGAALTQAGMPRIPSLVLAALLVDDDGRMTAPELAAALEISAGSVSGAVKYLGQLGVVRRERERGSRRDVYVVEDDAWHGALMQTDQLYAPIIVALGYGVAAVGDDSPARHRLELTLEFLEFVSAEMATLRERWDARHRDRAGGAAPRGADNG
jgi:hypothetical protein